MHVSQANVFVCKQLKIIRNTVGAVYGSKTVRKNWDDNKEKKKKKKKRYNDEQESSPNYSREFTRRKKSLATIKTTSRKFTWNFCLIFLSPNWWKLSDCVGIEWEDVSGAFTKLYSPKHRVSPLPKTLPVHTAFPLVSSTDWDCSTGF